ncbi:hypothetical protein SAMD00019534_050790 [Acytostelium subglobosum LB1]|uniref:hypothetical protein n=1 Tax=Acytostelium subglobosum LB1 TaxID=1410327 RepID=UPI000644A6A0|nr:hypothetical protein SAMD00019534_050790 [Acytostelium subglobosum LB1]GAM21904.1 hypothetical protein SAMD00019534_050790 [Acytostelium subglobosum LB1]|eukprot:XP_012755004.1 hypothetical protein SAMD00019534_050790 [Acytostelium subglobosum LB1]
MAPSTCFDGDKLIYLVGGTDSVGEQVPQVSSFNIETQQVTHIDNMRLGGLYGEYLFIYDNTLHFFQEYPGEVILTYNLSTKVQSQFALSSPFASILYDQKHTIFMVGKDNQFMSMSLATRQYKLLMWPSVPLAHDGNGLSFANNLVWWYSPKENKEELILLQGRGNNHRYSIDRNEWTKINDDDPVDNRVSFGFTFIYDMPQRLVN